MSGEKSRIAIYDMDKTVTRRPTYTPFLLHVARTHRPWRLLLAPFALVTVAAYAARLIDRGRLKELNHALLIGARLPAADAAVLAERYARHTLATNVLPPARARIAADRAAGFRLVLATASYEFYAHAIGEALGFDAVIATGVCRDEAGAVLARIDGQNCYGTAKLAMVGDSLVSEGLARDDCHVRFYSDHVSDAPCLGWADEAFAVNPHPPLRRRAALEGWTVFDWR